MSDTRTHNIWRGMKGRCETPSFSNYQNYGGRGIKVCERWQTFENFYADMGECPEGMSIERLDNNKDYEPGNCVWADRQTQASNKRNSVLITAHGQTLTLSQWARVTGLSKNTIAARLRAGLTGEDVVKKGYIRRGGEKE